MADAQHTIVRGRGRQEPIAPLDRRGHGLLEKHVLACLEGGAADLGVQMVGDDDVDGVDGRVRRRAR